MRKTWKTTPRKLKWRPLKQKNRNQTENRFNPRHTIVFIWRKKFRAVVRNPGLDGDVVSDEGRNVTFKDRSIATDHVLCHNLRFVELIHHWNNSRTRFFFYFPIENDLSSNFNLEQDSNTNTRPGKLKKKSSYIFLFPHVNNSLAAQMETSIRRSPKCVLIIFLSYILNIRNLISNERQEEEYSKRLVYLSIQHGLYTHTSHHIP